MSHIIYSCSDKGTHKCKRHSEVLENLCATCAYTCIIVYSDTLFAQRHSLRHTFHGDTPTAQWYSLRHTFHRDTPTAQWYSLRQTFSRGHTNGTMAVIAAHLFPPSVAKSACHDTQPAGRKQPQSDGLINYQLAAERMCPHLLRQQNYHVRFLIHFTK